MSTNKSESQTNALPLVSDPRYILMVRDLKK